MICNAKVSISVVNLEASPISNRNVLPKNDESNRNKSESIKTLGENRNGNGIAASFGHTGNGVGSTSFGNYASSINGVNSVTGINSAGINNSNDGFGSAWRNGSFGIPKTISKTESLR